MRRVLAAGLTLVLAACGGGDDFSLDVDRPAARVYGQLSSLDGGMVRQILGLPAIRRSNPADGELLYTIPGSGEEGDGTLAFRIEPHSESQARVHVKLELPTIRTRIHGIDKVLNESRAETMLHDKLDEWAANIKSGGSGHEHILQIDEMLGALALAMNPDRIDKVLAMSEKPEILAEFLGDRMAWEGASSEFSQADAPMSDPDRDAAQFAEPMDKATGSDPSWDSQRYGDPDY